MSYMYHIHHIIQTITNLIYQYIYIIHNIYTFFSNTLSLWSLTYFTSKLGKAFYSGQPQTLSFYHTVKRLGIPDSQIILMMAEVGITLDLMLLGIEINRIKKKQQIDQIETLDVFLTFFDTLEALDLE